MADFDFGLGGITEAFTNNKSLMLNRQAEEAARVQAESAKNEELAKIAKKSAEVSQKLVGDLSGLFGSIDAVESGKLEQDALRKSGDIGDFLQYVGNQVSKPNTHTQAGRAKTLAETQQLIGARTNQASLQQAAMQDLMAVVEADFAAGGGTLNAAKLLEQQSAERINAEVARVQTQGQLLASNNALIESKLAMMSEDEVRLAASKSRGQPVDVGGVMLSAGALESRMQVLEERKLLQEQRTLAQDAKRAELDKKLAQKELQTMSLEELRPLLQTGSERYELSDIESVYKIKTEAMTADMERQTQMFQYQDMGARLLVPAIEDADRIGGAVPKNTPLGNSLEAYKAVLASTIGVMDQYREAGKGVPIEVAAAANNAIQSGRADLDKAIDKEATLKAKGDKDLKDSYVEFYRGNPVPRASVESVITSRLKKNEPLDDIMPMEASKLIREKYATKLQEYKSKNALNPLSSTSNSQLEDQSMREAIAEGIAEVTVGRTQDMFKNQLLMPGHPLAGMVDGNQILGLVARADQQGIKTFQATYGLDDAELARFMAGEAIEGKVSQADAANLGVAQTQELLMLLDSQEAGLGKRYADWWVKNSNSYVAAQQAARQRDKAAGGIQEAALDSFAGPMEVEQTAAYTQLMIQAADGLDDAKEVRYNEMVSFDYKPENRQAALLQFDKTLTDSERKMFMKNFLLPIITEAQKDKNNDYTVVNRLIEQAIEANVAQDPETAKVLKKVQKNRGEIVESVESTMSQVFWRARNPNLRRRLNSIGQYQWYMDALEGK